MNLLILPWSNLKTKTIFFKHHLPRLGSLSRWEDILQIIAKKSLHSPKLAVSCDFWSDGIICSYFLRSKAGNTITVYEERFKSTIINFLWPKLKKFLLDNIWFQLDWAPISKCKNELFREKFGDSIISRNCDIEWHPRSKLRFNIIRLYLVVLLEIIGMFSNKLDSLQTLQDNILDMQFILMEKLFEI